jgi:hypothetical protein
MTRLLLLALAAPLAAAAQQPTAPAITDADLRVRLGIFAHDSMGGRQAGTEDHRRATRYLVAELQRLGLKPAGDSGTFLQAVPFVRRTLAADARLVLGDSSLVPWEDFAVTEASSATRSVDGAEVVYAGTLGAPPDSLLAADAARGKLVVLSLPENPSGQRLEELLGALLSGRYAGAAGIGVLDAYRPNPFLAARARQARLELDTRAAGDTSPPSPLFLAFAPKASAALRATAGGATLRPGTRLGSARGDVRQRSEPSPSYNVVAVLPGRDRRAAAQYVALGAHSDHEGPTTRAVDHDSLRAFHQALVDAGAEDPFTGTAAQRAAAARVNVDSARRGAPARPDSIRNGADDDGSGSMALLEIAEQMATARQRPRRSVLFVWHTGEELGMVGSGWFTEHPTVPRDSIVAQINVDMIGRGGPRDVAKLGGPGYLQVIGSKRLSSELGRLVEDVNRAGKHDFTFDYQYDAPGHPQQYYCRSDHYSYARFGIPVAFFSTGGHADYHQVTDEPQYLDYGKLARVTRFVGALAQRLADLDQRPVVDGPVTGPDAPCVQ